MKTLCIALGALALATAVPAWWPAAGPGSAALGRTNTVIGTPDAKSEQVASLAVYKWDDESKSCKAFEVRKQGGQWVIPSNHNYPADGGSRVGKTAGGVLNVRRGRFVTDDAKQHADLGVLDPQSDKVTDDKGRGKRVTVKDDGGKVLVDLIVGNRANDGDGMFFVREPDSNEVYTAKVDVDISTKFIDWVEADLLKLKRDDLRSIVIKDYSVDEVRGAIDQRAATVFTRKDANGDWTSEQAPADKRPSKDTLDKLVTELTSLRLAGIRPFSLRWLQQRGFFPSPDPTLVNDPTNLVIKGSDGGRYALVGNEGGITVTTKDGLRYQLFFGEVALGDDEDNDADAAKKKTGDAAKDADKKDGDKDKKDAAKTGHNRYLAVFCQYDAKADEDAAKKDEKKDGESAKPEDKKDPAGKTKAEKANKRFSQYFYVIPNDSFEKLRPAKDKLFEDKPKGGLADSAGKTNAQILEDNAKKAGVTKTASGLQYEVLTAGKPDGKQPKDGDQVTVKYKGMLVDGTEFDSSEKQPGGTASFNVNGVIKGWTEALKLMHEGDKWRLVIPPELGYGEQGSGDKIKANAILVFEVELVKVGG